MLASQYDSDAARYVCRQRGVTTFESKPDPDDAGGYPALVTRLAGYITSGPVCQWPPRE